MDFVGQQGVLKRRVLVVDDEMVNREILGNFLSTVYTVDYASNAKIALGMLMNPDVEYSLVLLDLNVTAPSVVFVRVFVNAASFVVLETLAFANVSFAAAFFIVNVTLFVPV